MMKKSMKIRKPMISEVNQSWFSDWRGGFGENDFCPDGGTINGEYIDNMADDAVAFVKIGDDFMFEPKAYHYEILQKHYTDYVNKLLKERGLEDNAENRSDLFYELLKSATYDGRLWTRKKIISLWGMPKGVNGMEQMRHDIESNIGVNLSEYTFGYKDGIIMPFDEFYNKETGLDDIERTPVHLMKAQEKLKYWQEKAKKSVIPFMGSDVAWAKAREAGYDTLAAYNFDRENNYKSPWVETKRRDINGIIKETIRRYMKAINEARPKNPMNVDRIDPFVGRKPKTIKARINQIYKLVNKYGLSSRKYHDESWAALDDYKKVIESLGCEFTCWVENGGYCDYDEHTNMNMSKMYNIEIEYDDGITINGYIKMMAAGSMEDPFDAYDTCMILWPKRRMELESKNKNINNIVNETIDRYINRIINE